MSTTTISEISIKGLIQKILSGEEVFILDVRNKNEFDEWKIEGNNVEVINKPYFELLDGLDPIMNQLPEDAPIYVICAKGGSSQMIAEEIAIAGYSNVASIEGGMKAYSEHLEPIKIGSVAGGTLYQFVRIGKGCLSYLIVSDGEGALIDINRMTEQYENFIVEEDIEIKYLIDTHLHADHISGGKKLADKLNATYYLPPKDAGEVTFDYSPIQEGDNLKVGQTIIKPLYSPGHTIGSTSFIVDDEYLMTGDILFIDSIGRPDLAGKAEDWVADLRNSLYIKYKELADELIVLPAHYMSIKEMNKDGSVSEKLGVLFQNNHGLNMKDEEEFRRAVTDNLPPQPNSYQDIRETNMGIKTPEIEKQREMEVGPNRCAIRE